MHEVETRWNEEMSFTSTVNGHDIIIDAAEQFGGKNRGPRPKPLLLTSLTGCTGMDVIAILGKMKVKVESLTVSAKATLAEEHPQVYTRIELLFEFRGKDLPTDKINKAVALSQEKYCAVSAMVRKSCLLGYEIKVEK
jgi:putative redox protein